jgi:hypothetical protein
MNLLSYFPDITLTSDQRNAMEQLSIFLNSDDRIFILQGYAGTGKTTLLKGFIKYLSIIEKKYQLMAPTGRAAKVIHQKTGVVATTVHKGIYSFEELYEIEQSDSKNDLSFLYQYKLGNNPDAHHSIFLVDEASMISDIVSQGEFFRFGSGRLLEDLISYSRVKDKSASSKIIFIGDPAQLPPIGMNYSPALSEAYLKEKYDLKAASIEMTEVKRQDADNGILNLAKQIRQSLNCGYFNHFNLKANGRDLFNPAYDEYLNEYKSVSGKKIIICYKNRTARDLNAAIRQDKFGEELPIQKSDIVIVGTNNYKLNVMNGEFAVVNQVSSTVVSREIPVYNNKGEKIKIHLTWRKAELLMHDVKNKTKSVVGYILENFLDGENHLMPEEQKALYIDFKIRYSKLKKGTHEFKEALIKDEFFNCIQLKYGYAVTCHKAQGGEWNNAFVFWDRGTSKNFNFFESQQQKTGKSNSDFYRWAYTAITRASQSLYCINPPYFSSFSNMTYVDIDVQKVLQELTGEANESFKVNFEDLQPDLEKFNLLDAPLSIQNHFIECVTLSRKRNITVENWQQKGYEIWYGFERDGQSAGFKFWINGKNTFKESFQKLPGMTSSDELFQLLSDLFKQPVTITVERNTVEEIIKQIEFDGIVENEKPFLRNLFDEVVQSLDNAHITEIKHLSYKDRYTLVKEGKEAVIDFSYDGDGFFGQVVPLVKRCESLEILDQIKSIVNRLNKGSYVV